MSDRKDYLYCLLIGLFLAIIAYFFNFTWGNGIILGVAMGLLHYIIMAFCLSRMLKLTKFSIGLFILYFFANMGNIILALAISCLLPNIFNVIACAIGLILHNAYIYGKTLFISLKKGKGCEL